MTSATHPGSCHRGAVALEVETDLEGVAERGGAHGFPAGLWRIDVAPFGVTPTMRYDGLDSV